MKLASTDPSHTESLGRALGEVAGAGLVIGLVGDLGAGKTLFVQGLARGLGVAPDARVVSPTFTLINQYPGGRLPLAHADLYRLEAAEELDEIGLDELCRGDGVVAIEWCDKFDVLPKDALRVALRVVGEGERAIEVEALAGAGAAALAAWAARLGRA